MVGNWMDRRSFPGEERGCANPLVEFFFFFVCFFFPRNYTVQFHV